MRLPLHVNISESIEKARNILITWSNRNLSLVGKIQIVNTLAASLFVYKMSALPNIPVQYLDNISKIINSFIWNNKRPKIKTETLAAPKELGGLGLVNMTIKDKALKSQWVKFALDNDQAKPLIYRLMNNPIGDYIWECQFIKKDIINILPGIDSVFWQNVLENWSEINFNDPISGDQVRQQILWFNSNIRIEEKPVLFNNWLVKGIVKIIDLLNEDNQFLSYSDFTCKYNFKPAFTEYYGLLKSIPIQWKRWIKDENGPKYSNMAAKFKACDKVARYGYNLLFQDREPLLTQSFKWQTKIDPSIRSEHLTEATIKGWKITNIAKLRSFHYWIVSFSLTTNINLFHYKIRKDKNCSFCDGCEETMKHMFIECEKITPLLEYVKSMALNCQDCDFKNVNLLLSSVHTNPKHPINTVVLIMKPYIYVT